MTANDISGFLFYLDTGSSCVQTILNKLRDVENVILKYREQCSAYVNETDSLLNEIKDIRSCAEHFESVSSRFRDSVSVADCTIEREACSQLTAETRMLIDDTQKLYHSVLFDCNSVEYLSAISDTYKRDVDDINIALYRMCDIFGELCALMLIMLEDDQTACCPEAIPEPCAPDDFDAAYSPGGLDAVPLPPTMNATLSAPSQAGAVKVKPVRADKVSFSVLSPERTIPGRYGKVWVYMYTKSQRKVVEKALKAAKEALAETSKSGFMVSRGSEVMVELCSDDVTIKENRDSRIWDGKSTFFDFQFLVPQNYKRSQAAFTCYVYFNGLQITRLSFTIDIRTTKRVPVKLKRTDHRNAFVSYCHRDEKRVLSQLAAIQEVAPRMMFWLDNQSLESGDIWRREIERAIRKSDVFLLFWSIHARQSEEVKREWKYALKKKGLRFIAPIPLDPPSECPPPPELEALHFGHRSFHQSSQTENLTFTNSRRVKIIK